MPTTENTNHPFPRWLNSDNDELKRFLNRKLAARESEKYRDPDRLSEQTLEELSERIEATTLQLLRFHENPSEYKEDDLENEIIILLEERFGLGPGEAECVMYCTLTIARSYRDGAPA